VPDVPSSTWRLIRNESTVDLVKDAVGRAQENRLFLYATAISYRGLTALIPLILFGFALLGALGLSSTWQNSIKPAVDGHVEKPVADAIDYSVEQIFAGSSAGLLLFAGVLLLWNMTIAVAVIMDALNEIHGVTERRSLRRRAATATALAGVTGGLLMVTLIVLSAAPLIGSGWLHTLFAIGRWLVAPLLLAVVIALLIRYGPAERPETEWASAGSVLVVVVWVTTSAVFFWWMSVANYKSATGNLTVLLTISLYLFVSSAIFLVGAQLDELIRKRSHQQG
jgi:membrane protein